MVEMIIKKLQNSNEFYLNETSKRNSLNNLINNRPILGVYS